MMKELLDSDQVRMMGRWKHHGPVTTLDHSLFVAFSTYRVARLLRMDVRAAVRGRCSTTCTSTTPRINPPTRATSASTIPGSPPGTPPPSPRSPPRSGTSFSPTCGPWGAPCPGLWRPGWWTWWTPSAPDWRCPVSAAPPACGSGWGYVPWSPPADKRYPAALPENRGAVFVAFEWLRCENCIRTIWKKFS